MYKPVFSGKKAELVKSTGTVLISLLLLITLLLFQACGASKPASEDVKHNASIVMSAYMDNNFSSFKESCDDDMKALVTEVRLKAFRDYAESFGKKTGPVQYEYSKGEDDQTGFSVDVVTVTVPREKGSLKYILPFDEAGLLTGFSVE